MHNIPRYIIHGAIVKHHLIKNGIDNIPGLNVTWYYDMEKQKIVIEGN